MSKIMHVELNPFISGMMFNTYVEIKKFLEQNGINHRVVNKDILNHYCEFHFTESKEICIDIVKDYVEPFRIKGFMYDVGQIIDTNTGSIVILDKYIGGKINTNIIGNVYLCKCLKDDYEFELSEYRIKQGIGCPICGNRKVIPGIRSLYDDYPDVLKYLVYPDEAKSISPHSSKRVLCRCTECGSEKEMSVSNLVSYGFRCDFCSDNISFPNKFVRNMLRQIGINFITEKYFDWSNGKFYDQYLEQYNMIIENHGKQHYENISGSKFPDLIQQHNNDIYKYNMAIDNGIQHYIVLDCRKSELNWIKKSIMESPLPSILNFNENDIDWNLCYNVAKDNSEIKRVCKEYESNHCASDLAKILGHDVHTILEYLYIGSKCGYCDYEKYNSKTNGKNDIWQARTKPIYSETDDIYFMSPKYCEQYYKSIGYNSFNGKHLYNYINKHKKYNDKYFRYISKSEYNNVYDISLRNNNLQVYGIKFLDKYIKEEQ